MGRPANIVKIIKKVISEFRLGGFNKPNTESGRIPNPKDRYRNSYWEPYRRAEKPTHRKNEFRFMMDVLTCMPAAENAFRMLADDAAHDENGDDTAWSILPTVEPLSDSETDENVAEELQEQLLQLGDDYISRTKIGYKTKHIIYLFMTRGDCFGEQIIYVDPETGFGQIDGIKVLPTFQMRCVSDDFGNPKAYEQHTDQNDRNPIVWSIPQQIVHWAFNKFDYNKYGESALAALRDRWEKFKLVELDALMALHSRAIAPEIHKIGTDGDRRGVSDDVIEDYKAKLGDQPNDMHRRYVVKKGYVDIDVLKTGDAQSIETLFRIRKELENDFVEFLGVSGHLTGNTQDIGTRRTGQTLDQKHTRKVASIRGDFTHYIFPSILLEYALHGIHVNEPDKHGVKKISLNIVWPSLGETRIMKSKRAIFEGVSGFASWNDVVLQLGYRNPAALRKQIKKDREDLMLPDPNALPPVISNNGEQGAGVPNDDETADKEPQAKSKSKAESLAQSTMAWEKFLNGES